VLLDEAARIEEAPRRPQGVMATVGTSARSTSSRPRTASPNEDGEGNYFHWLWERRGAPGSPRLPRRLLHPDRDEEWYETAREYLILDAQSAAPSSTRAPPRRRSSSPRRLLLRPRRARLVRDEAVAKPLYRCEFEKVGAKAAKRRSAPTGLIKVYEEPNAEHTYAIAVDVASGRGRDYSVAYVIDLATMAPVAELRAKIDPDLLAFQLHFLGRWYGTGRAAARGRGDRDRDRAGHGEAVIVPLRDGREGRPKYTRLYRRRRASPRTNDGKARDYGFKINDKTRPQVLSLLQRAIRERLLPWVTSDLLQECRLVRLRRHGPRRAPLTAATTTASSPGRSRSSSTASSATTPAGRAARRTPHGLTRRRPPMLKKLHDAAKRVLAAPRRPALARRGDRGVRRARRRRSPPPTPSSRRERRPRRKAVKKRREEALRRSPTRPQEEEGVAARAAPAALPAPAPGTPTDRSQGPPPPAGGSRPARSSTRCSSSRRSTARSRPTTQDKLAMEKVTTLLQQILADRQADTTSAGRNYRRSAGSRAVGAGRRALDAGREGAEALRGRLPASNRGFLTKLRSGARLPRHPRPRSDAKRWQSQLARRSSQHIVESTLAAIVDGKLAYRVKPRRGSSTRASTSGPAGAKAHEILHGAQLKADRFHETSSRSRCRTRSPASPSRRRSGAATSGSGRAEGRPRRARAELGRLPAAARRDRGVDVCYDGPTTEVVNVEDFYWHEAATELQKSPVIAHRVWMHFSDLKRLEAQGQYQNVDELKNARDQAASTPSRIVDGTSRSKDMIEVLEIWWKEPDGRSTRVTLGNRKVELSPPRKNPFWHGEYPFVRLHHPARPVLDPGQEPGREDRDLQEAHWDLENQTRDNVG
jgi:hypothetical protein